MFQNDKRDSIGHRTINGIIVFTLLLTIAVSLPVTYGFSVLTKRNYYDNTRDYAGIVSHVINGDTVRYYIETGEKDAYYFNTKVFLTSLCDEIDLTDISIFIPDGDEAIYVWDTEGGEGDHDLGARTDVFRNYKLFYNPDPEEFAPVEINLVRTQNGVESYISVFMPLYDSNYNTVAIVCVTRPEIMLGTVISQFILAIIATAALVSSVVMLIVYRLINRNFIKPIGLLTKSAKAMVDNLESEEAVSIDIHTNDELETLADAFRMMDKDLREYIEELSAITAERERISGELDAAAKIQIGILPKLGLQYDDMEEYDLAASMTPAREVGGDSIFVYTDGVTEATNIDKRLFGEERLLAALNKNRDASPDELLKNVNDSIDEFVNDAPQFDDITMLAFRYNGKQ